MLSRAASKVACSSGAGVMRLPAHGELGLAAGRVLEGEGREQLQRPGRRHRMPGHAALLVRERIDEDQLFPRHDLAIGEQAPHRRAVRRLHAVVVGTADAQVHVRRDDREALRPPPLLHALRIGEALPEQIARRVEYARHDEVFGWRLAVSSRISASPSAAGVFDPSETSRNRAQLPRAPACRKAAPSGGRNRP